MRASGGRQASPSSSGGRSIGHRNRKSPLKIRDRIRELDQKLEKERMSKNMMNMKNKIGKEKLVNYTKESVKLMRAYSLDKLSTNCEKNRKRKQLNEHI